MYQYQIPEELRRKIETANAAGRQAAAHAKQVLTAEAAAIEAVRAVHVDIPKMPSAPTVTVR